jgi:hypothetical protein
VAIFRPADSRADGTLIGHEGCEPISFTLSKVIKP